MLNLIGQKTGILTPALAHIMEVRRVTQCASSLSPALCQPYPQIFESVQFHDRTCHIIEQTLFWKLIGARNFMKRSCSLRASS